MPKRDVFRTVRREFSAFIYKDAARPWDVTEGLMASNRAPVLHAWTTGESVIVAYLGAKMYRVYVYSAWGRAICIVNRAGQVYTQAMQLLDAVREAGKLSGDMRLNAGNGVYAAVHKAGV